MMHSEIKSDQAIRLKIRHQECWLLGEALKFLTKHVTIAKAMKKGKVLINCHLGLVRSWFIYSIFNLLQFQCTKGQGIQDIEGRASSTAQPLLYCTVLYCTVLAIG